MAHSIITYRGGTYVVRDDVLEFPVRKLRSYAVSENISWLSVAGGEWLEHCAVMPPGAKNIELDRWLLGENERSQLMMVIDHIANKELDPGLMRLMHLDDLRTLID